ncbi:MAG: flgH [Phycisphaerales bacterium]|nr:flgH [Phycisphaerales bacterium]
MNRQKSILTKASFHIAMCLTGALALGQAVPQTQQETAEGRTGPHLDRTGLKPSNNNAAAQAGVMMSRTGGSLLKATLVAPPDPGQAKLSQVSFFAVPEKEPKVLKKHDLVTIIIREESQMDSKATTDLTKNAEFKAAVNQMVKLKLSNFSIYGLPTPAATPAVDITGNRTFTGDGEVKRDDSLTARITAEILDVKPNGTLVLQARKRIKHDEEEQQFILTGTCRAEDINADNTLLSTQLYDLELQKNTKGNVRNATERGNVSKLLDFINPF